MTSLFHRGMGAKMEEYFVKAVIWRGREVLKRQDKLKTTFMENPRKYNLGLDRTEHMSFLTGQDRTLKFAGQVLPDRTESGLIISNFLP